MGYQNHYRGTMRMVLTFHGIVKGATAMSTMFRTRDDSDDAKMRRRAVQQAVVIAAQTGDMTQFDAYHDLMALSSNTQIDDFDVDEDFVILNGNLFSGAGNIYVILNYGSKDDEITESAGFLCKFSGHFEGEIPIIEQMEVDVSGFYGE